MSRGRPRGLSARGADTRQRLFDAAVGLMGQRGYAATTLRDVAASTGVSVGLLYRYFPSKRAVVLELYDQLSADFLRQSAGMPRGRWRVRFIFALNASLGVLRPHRRAMSALVPLLVGDPQQGLFAPGTAFSRIRVQRVFDEAVRGATDAPKQDAIAPLARLLYLVHLAVILWWLLDRSPRQRATGGLVALMERALPRAALTLRLPLVRSLVREGDALFREALLAGADDSIA
jgi:AcrR family transcriptional regulator